MPDTDPNSPLRHYQDQIHNLHQERGRHAKGLRYFPWIRLLTLLFTIAGIYWYLKSDMLSFILIPIASFSAFIAAGYRDFSLKKKIRRLEQLIALQKDEIEALNGNVAQFHSGTEFIDPAHAYTFDLDIFGEKSLFQTLCRSVTPYGKIRLASFFSNAYDFRNQIIDRQKAVAELAQRSAFRDEFRIIFAETSTNPADLENLEKWLSDNPGSSARKALMILRYLLPFLTIATIVTAIAGMISSQIPTGLVLLQLFIVFSLGRKTAKVHEGVTAQVKILEKYSRALRLVESTRFSSPFLHGLKKETESGNHISPSEAIKKLSTLLGLLDANLNMLVAVLLNGLFLFNLHVLAGVEVWRERYRNKVKEWFDMLGEIDAMASLGNFAFNHPDYTYPEIKSGDFLFHAENAGHPLIPVGECVRNDISIEGWKQFRIITGANMSGKSTFLRTVGVNAILGMTGAPVCAGKLLFTPMEIFSSIRTNDSLSKRESYFYAELRRLKSIVDELRKGRQLLVILDEILKGTNSVDKQAGSLSLIRHLMQYNLAGLFATHDLALGKLRDEFPENIQNLCFEIAIEGDRMEIDYRLREGVCKNLNASFLMKNMGILSPGSLHQ